MKTLLLLCLLVLLSYHRVYSQEVIVRRDSVKMMVKITELSNETVRYRIVTDASNKTHELSTVRVAYIIFSDGSKQIFNSTAENGEADDSRATGRRRQFYSYEDSLRYFRYKESVSVNLLNFLNNEVGIVYQRDNLDKNYNLVIPFGIGVARPVFTYTMYFKDNFNYSIDRKLFETGLGINYFPTYRSNVNYYLGPMLRAIFYEGTQVLPPGRSNPFITKKNTLTRMCLTITNGILIRTKSRIQLSMFFSMGVKGDMVMNKIIEPYSQKKIDPIKRPFGIYTWMGFMLGYCF